VQLDFLIRELKRFSRIPVADQCVHKLKLIYNELDIVNVLMDHHRNDNIDVDTLIEKRSFDRLNNVDWKTVDVDVQFGANAINQLRLLDQKCQQFEDEALRNLQQHSKNAVALIKTMYELPRDESAVLGLQWTTDNAEFIHCRVECGAVLQSWLLGCEAFVVRASDKALAAVIQTRSHSPAAAGTSRFRVLEWVDGIPCSLYCDANQSWLVATAHSADGSESVAGMPLFINPTINGWYPRDYEDVSVTQAFWKAWHAQNHNLPGEQWKDGYVYQFQLRVTPKFELLYVNNCNLRDMKSIVMNVQRDWNWKCVDVIEERTATLNELLAHYTCSSVPKLMHALPTDVRG
jgi:hypothetical protein